MSQAVDLGPSVPCLFILMEYAQGGSIHDLIHPRKPETAAERKKAIRKKRQGTSDDYREFLEEKDIWPLLHDTCQGLRYLHRLHIVHTDVKPPNLLLDMCPYNNRLKVLISDFGTSKQIESACSDSIQNRRSGNTGTIDFTAPEVLVCDEMGRFVNPFTEKADMWSLGVVLYEMAFGVLPWRENRSQQLPWQAQVTSQILDFDYRIHLPPDIGLNGQSPPKRSPELLEVIKSLLERSADLRPSSEEIFDLPAFQAGIERYVNTESVPRGRSRSVRSPSKRYHSTTLSPRSKYQVEEPQRSDHFQIQEIQRHSPPPLELQPFAHSSKTIQTDRKRPHQDTSEEESNSVSVLSEPPIHERDHQQSNEQLSVSRRESRELIPYSESLAKHAKLKDAQPPYVTAWEKVQLNLRKSLPLVLFSLRHMRMMSCGVSVHGMTGDFHRPQIPPSLPILACAYYWSSQENQNQKRKRAIMWIFMELALLLLSIQHPACKYSFVGWSSAEMTPPALFSFLESALWVVLAYLLAA
eukprot:TRINITY_DN6448_c0_g1_i2.p1 TRINITY_DN6448_c0_g1~~TRINITY_DN6448_c0_g1_i2.p1  ORF type:complete len:524 (+),score=87.57 TRINITY_DN6448_c0_g1_i2:141-1712(+)